MIKEYTFLGESAIIKKRCRLHDSGFLKVQEQKLLQRVCGHTKDRGYRKRMIRREK